MTVDENTVQLQLYARAQAPSRDYYGLTITQSKIILNIWNISYGPHVYPKRQVSTLEDFPDQRIMQNDIQRTFGIYALDFAQRFAAKERNLQYLPMKIFLKVIRYLATNDIVRISQTSKIFFDICNNDAVWKIIYRKKIKRRLMLGDMEKGTELGWKQALKSKVMSRVQLRNLLDKNETNLAPQTKLNNFSTPKTTGSTPYLRHPSSNNLTTHKNPAALNKSSMTIIRNIKETLPDRKRISKSTVNVQKSSQPTICERPARLSMQNIEEKRREIKLPVNKSKITQSAITLGSNSTSAKLKNELDGYLMKNANLPKSKVDKHVHKHSSSSKITTKKK